MLRIIAAALLLFAAVQGVLDFSSSIHVEEHTAANGSVSIVRTFAIGHGVMAAAVIGTALLIFSLVWSPKRV